MSSQATTVPEPAAPTDPLLGEAPGQRELLMGNEAVVRGALEAGVGFAAGYPGTPSSEVTDSLARVAPARGIAFEYSINEKIALEMAFAASLAGVRSICAMKHLGLMVAGDPLSTIPYMGVVGGMVIVSAGDPSCHTSPNEQDQRHLGPMLHIPVLDPSTPAEALEMTRLGFELSEESELPVLLRITARVCHSRAVMRYGALGTPRPARFEKNPARFVPMPAHARELRKLIPGRLARARALLDERDLYRESGDGQLAIVATGSPVAACRDLVAEQDLSATLVLAAVGAPHPLPTEQLAALLGRVDKALVVEELSPLLEDALRALAYERKLEVEILGKRTGHLPVPFEYQPEIIARGVRQALSLGPEVAPAPVSGEQPLPGRPPILCPGCPHRSTYYAARAAFGREQLYFNDIGCYTLGAGEPLDTADALLCMGAGYTLAAGVSRVTGQRTVGFMGDSTFFHAGMPALLNAAQQDANMVAVILDNQVTAMTGFQPSPTATMGESLPAKHADIEAVVRALGASHVEKIDPANLPESIAAFERARDGRGLSVIIAEHACPVHESRQRGKPLFEGTYQIDATRCQSCGRQGCGLRCELSTTVGQERHMARSRSLELYPSDDAKPPPAEVARCAQYCPLALCIQGYAGHIAAGQYQQAFELITSRNPLPDTVCRVCHRPCESACVRAGIDAPVAINDLKRFVMDWAAEHLPSGSAPAREPEHGLRVAVVGAGPSGLGAAHELALRGYRVTLLDGAEQPGGLLRYGIPRFRLPLEPLERDIARILALGVQFEGGQQLGRDYQLDTLLGRGFDAVLLAIGAGRSTLLGLDAADGPGGPEVVDALAYLATAGDRPAAKRVVVIGGGNAAIDAARTAARRGADTVLVAYRRARQDMPALREEVRAAIDEGVGMRLQLAPLAAQGGDAPGLVCRRTEPGPPDESGRRRPVPVEGTEVLIEADRIIVAIGQRAQGDLSVAGTALDRDATGNLRIDPLTGACSHPRVFAGGDVSGGPRTVTDAIAAGQRAGWGIDRALRGEQAAGARTPPPLAEAWPGVTLPDAAPATGRIDQGARARPPERDPATRTGGFDEVVGRLDEAAARAEARRCMVCGRCGNCRACIDLFGCPAFSEQDGQVHIDPHICTACGMCATLCPNGAISYLAPGTAPRAEQP